MGRGVAKGRVPVYIVQETFAIREGKLVWLERPKEHFPCRPDDHTRFNALHAGTFAGFRGPGPTGAMMVRLSLQPR